MFYYAQCEKNHFYFKIFREINCRMAYAEKVALTEVFYKNHENKIASFSHKFREINFPTLNQFDKNSGKEFLLFLHDVQCIFRENDSLFTDSTKHFLILIDLTKKLRGGIYSIFRFSKHRVWGLESDFTKNSSNQAESSFQSEMWICN